MKAVLYALINEQSISWHVSMDMRADMAYWFGEHPGSLRIWMLQPAVSYGQALALREQLNSIKWKAQQWGKPDRLLQIIKRQANDLNIPLFSKEHVQEEHLVECDNQQWESYRITEAGRVFTQQEELDKLIHLMAGRSLLLEEIGQLMDHHQLLDAQDKPLLYVQMGILYGKLQADQGIRMYKKRRLPAMQYMPAYECHRCGSDGKHMVFTSCLFCRTLCPYCEQCLTMGRSRFCSIMISSANHLNLERKKWISPDEADAKSNDLYIKPWGLSEVQTEASNLALEFLKGNEYQLGQAGRDKIHQFLIWAVTGAGKTEMIFPMIQFMLLQGGHVVVATPRRDVVLELKPRLEKAFSSTPVVTLYGGSEQRWDTGTLTIATTHQLLRFERAFDLVIIDELDAFPFHNNPMLEYAAQKVCKTGGVTLLLSATPPKHLQKAAKRGQLPHVKVAARYHRHPLPVPILVPIPSLSQQQKRSILHSKLREKLAASLSRGAQIFVFVPKIVMIEPLIRLLHGIFPDIVTQGTSSKDEERAQKVIDFRNAQIRMLVTTTILERGVTIAKSDVFILDADAPIFDSAALVQMAGRAGRSAEDPAGNVYFAAKEKTRDQVEAIRQIKGMNALARKKGYLRVKGESDS